MIAIDTNILIYAHREETDQHQAALARIEALASGSVPWAIPLFCITEFLRVVTHRRIFNPPSSSAQALEFVHQLTAAPSCRLLTPGDDFLEHLNWTVQQGDARGNLVYDAKIAAVCREHGVNRLLTNDRNFSRFDAIEAVALA